MFIVATYIRILVYIILKVNTCDRWAGEMGSSVLFEDDFETKAWKSVKSK